MIHATRAICAFGAFGASGCTGPPSTPTSQPPLVVLAASSLSIAFAELEAGFEATHPGLDVVISTAGSQALRAQIEHGAGGDVFASANAYHMQAVVNARLVHPSIVFTRGQLVIIVPLGNPAGIRTVADLPKAQRLILGAAHVPIGTYARRMLDQAEQRYGAGFRHRVESRVVSLEPNSKLVLAKLELGEADAAVVYRSDATDAQRIRAIPIPAELNVDADYHTGVLVDTPNAALALAWIAYVTSDSGQGILRDHGFAPVPHV
ncbi:MAG: molybdate ABC transporter substrate-binding protein [Nannocystaceae bacterium]